MAAIHLLFHPTPFLPTSRRPKFHRHHHHHHHALSLPKPPKLFSPHSPPISFPIKTPLRPNIKHLTRIPSLPLHLPSLSLTPISICKWALVLALTLTLTLAKLTSSLLLNPFFWTYFSLLWPLYPYSLAISLAIFGFLCFVKHSRSQATVFEQAAMAVAVSSWLTIVPVAHANGFVEGWPIVLFFAYLYFSFFEPSVRSRLYGDLLPRPHHPKWGPHLSLPAPSRLTFFLLVLAGHFFAAFEGPELHLIPGGANGSAPAAALLALALFARYHAVLYLAKYTERTAEPTAVVGFGPYRWVRHPVYASTIALFAAHCAALRAPLSLAFLAAVCVWHYGRKAELEEAAMAAEFGEEYVAYADKVRYRLIPFVY